MALAQLGSLLPHVVVPAVMPSHLIPEWNLTYSQAGLMAASYAAGYMVAVPVLTTLTDRIDARLILFWGSLLSGIATIVFGFLAAGLVSATILWGLAGVGFAGAYMPGLKALTDRLERGDSSRSITLYTAASRSASACHSSSRRSLPSVGAGGRRSSLPALALPRWRCLH